MDCHASSDNDDRINHQATQQPSPKCTSNEGELQFREHWNTFCQTASESEMLFESLAKVQTTNQQDLIFRI